MTQPQSNKPLAGKKIVVTRARAQANKLAAALEGLGATVVEFPTIEIVPVNPLPDVGDLSAFDWLVFTSANGVECFSRAVESLTDKTVKVCAVGPATKEALEARGVSVDLVPDDFDAEGAYQALAQTEGDLTGKRILLPRGDIARPYLPDALQKAGADVTEVVVYRTVCPEISDGAVDALVAERPDVVTFTSASTARHYGEILGAERVAAMCNVVYASIGPQTTEVAEASGLSISIEPERHDVPGLVEAVVGAVGI